MARSFRLHFENLDSDSVDGYGFVLENVARRCDWCGVLFLEGERVYTWHHGDLRTVSGYIGGVWHPECFGEWSEDVLIDRPWLQETLAG